MSQSYFTHAPAGSRRPERGEWILVRRIGDGAVSAWIGCPVCGDTGTLFDVYTIDAAGFVSPEIVCLTPGCHYSETARLEGWDPAGRATFIGPAHLARSEA